MDENGLGTNPNCESMTMNMPVAGDHVFKVTDGNGCTCIKHYNPGESSTVDCNWTNLGLAVSRDGDGNVTLEGRNGTPPYQYSEGGYSYGDNNVFTSMSAGNHTFWVKDAAGCQFSREVEVEVDNSVSLGGRPCAGVNTVTDVDGNVYHTLQIGQQCWMAENLRTTHYANGEPIGIDPTGGASYTIEGTQQLLSVPYALYADRAANTFSGDYNDLSNKPDIPTVPTNVSVFTNDAGYITMDSVPEIPLW